MKLQSEVRFITDTTPLPEAEPFPSQMNFTNAVNSTDLPDLVCSTGRLYHFQMTTGVLVSCIFSCLIDTAIIMTSIPSNILVILAIYLKASLHHNYQYVLLMLAVSDLLIGTFLQPLFLTYKIEQMVLNIANCSTATAFYAIRTIITMSSIIMELAVSLERTLAVLSPFQYEQWVTPRRIVVAPMCLLLAWTVFDVSRFWGLPNQLFVWTLSLCLFCSLLTISTCYGLMVKVSKHHSEQIAALPQPFQTAAQTRKKKRETKALKTALTIGGTYFICYTPLAVGLIVRSCLPMTQKELFLLDAWIESIARLSASLNPLVLCWRNSRIRGAMKAILQRNDNMNDVPMNAINL